MPYGGFAGRACQVGNRLASRGRFPMTWLEPGCVHVEWIETAFVSEQGWERLTSMLSAEEQARAARFHFEQDRQVYLAGHALMRDILARYTGRPPSQWHFSKGPHGKPEAILHEGEPRLRINMSHTRGLAAVAVTLGSDVGIDVEWVARETACQDLASRFFSPAEQDYLARQMVNSQVDAFFTLWTLKEAYLKATGLGLAMPLSDFSFDPEGPSIAFADHVADDPAQWSFLNHRLSPAYTLSVAVRRPGMRASDFKLVSGKMNCR
jgi:4'-phosphopantetheinyl transferase